MKRVFLFGIIMAFYFACVQGGYCWDWGKPEKKAEVKKTEQKAEDVKAVVAEERAQEVVSVSSETKASQASKADLDKIRVLREKKRNDLNNTQWEVEVTALSGKGTKQLDSIIFKDNRFSSDMFAKLGFGESNYTISMQDNNSIVIETMQSSEKEGMIFWRIELDQALASCKGILSHQLTTNKTEDYSFVSVSKKPVLSTPAAAPKEVKKNQ